MSKRTHGNKEAKKPRQVPLAPVPPAGVAAAVPSAALKAVAPRRK